MLGWEQSWTTNFWGVNDYGIQGTLNVYSISEFVKHVKHSNASASENHHITSTTHAWEIDVLEIPNITETCAQ